MISDNYLSLNIHVLIKSRQFPTVERRALLLQRNGYVSVPDAINMFDPLAKALGISLRLNKSKETDEVFNLYFKKYLVCNPYIVLSCILNEYS